MFKIPIEYSEIKLNAPIAIEGDTYKTLLADSEPILWTGLNSEGQRIIASYFDGNTNKQLDLYCIVDENTYKNFLNGEISLRSIYENSQDLYIVRSIKDSHKVFKINIKILPQELLPSEKSFLRKKSSYTYKQLYFDKRI